VDAIAERIHTSKRMIYYYFGSKEQLYVEVLEKLYGDIRSTENRLHLAELAPVEAIRRWNSPSITMTATSISCASSASKTSTTPST
jgi:AcrR family transcriptional regulator